MRSIHRIQRAHDERDSSSSGVGIGFVGLAVDMKEEGVGIEGGRRSGRRKSDPVERWM